MSEVVKVSFGESSDPLPDAYEDFSGLEIEEHPDGTSTVQGIKNDGGTESKADAAHPLDAFGHGMARSMRALREFQDDDGWQNGKRKDYLENRGLPYYEPVPHKPITFDGDFLLRKYSELGVKALPENPEVVNGLLLSLLKRVQKLEEELDRRKDVDEVNQRLKSELEDVKKDYPSIPVVRKTATGYDEGWTTVKDSYEISNEKGTVEVEKNGQRDRVAESELINEDHYKELIKLRDEQKERAEEAERLLDEAKDDLQKGETGRLSVLKDAKGALELTFEGKDVEISGGGPVVRGKVEEVKYDDFMGFLVVIAGRSYPINEARRVDNSVPPVSQTITEQPSIFTRSRNYLAGAPLFNRFINEEPIDPLASYPIEVDIEGRPYYEKDGKKIYLDRRTDRRFLGIGAAAGAAAIFALGMLTWELADGDADHPVTQGQVTTQTVTTTTTEKVTSPAETVTAPAETAPATTLTTTGSSGGGGFVTLSEYQRVKNKLKNLNKELAADEKKLGVDDRELASKSARLEADEAKIAELKAELNTANRKLRRQARRAGKVSLGGNRVAVVDGEGYTDELQKMFPGHNGNTYWRLHLHLLQTLDPNYLIGVPKYKQSGDWRLSRAGSVQLTAAARKEAIKFLSDQK